MALRPADLDRIPYGTPGGLRLPCLAYAGRDGRHIEIRQDGKKILEAIKCYIVCCLHLRNSTRTTGPTPSAQVYKRRQIARSAGRR
jgi:hypothetical protein